MNPLYLMAIFVGNGKKTLEIGKKCQKSQSRDLQDASNGHKCMLVAKHPECNYMAMGSLCSH